MHLQPYLQKRNAVVIHQDYVTKQFADGARRGARFLREYEALQRLERVEGTPALLAFSPSRRELTISRIPGQPFLETSDVSDEYYLQLRTLIEDMLWCGVARHSLPPRDLLVRPDGSPALVDFERVTLRGPHASPIWWAARMVTRFLLLRFLDQHAPHMLSGSDKRRLHMQYRLGNGFRRYRDWRRRLEQ